eukprot:5662536-Pleurochrysis_carterae.AAC.1
MKCVAAALSVPPIAVQCRQVVVMSCSGLGGLGLAVWGTPWVVEVDEASLAAALLTMAATSNARLA